MTYKAAPKSVVGTGCVGECGNNVTVPYMVPKGISKVAVKIEENSLCPNTDALAYITGSSIDPLVGPVFITDEGSSLMANVAAGDNIVLYVTLAPLFNGIVCIRLGTLNFHLVAS
ncbi:MAG: hypothetical protein QNJ46_12655 [Leptolyngbyaceae cyanobacterium MO_188.B28]|nr:hypothetical protein [Leptolyngbyaceae cyanobacterium MO_188.B28]